MQYWNYTDSYQARSALCHGGSTGTGAHWAAWSSPEVSRSPFHGLVRGPRLETRAHSPSIGECWCPLARTDQQQAGALNLGSVQSQNDWSNHQHIRAPTFTVVNVNNEPVIFQGRCLKVTLHTHISWLQTILKEG